MNIKKARKKRKITLMLAGGGVKAISYLGFVRALIEADIEIDVFAGFSGGALVAAAHSMGKNDEEVIKFVQELKVTKFIDLSIFTRRSLLSDKKINTYLENFYGKTRFTDLKYRNIIITTNLDKKKLEFFEKGYIIKYLRASMALAPIIPSIFINKDEHLDGTFMTTFPTKFIRKKTPENLIIGLIPKKDYQVLPEFVIKRARYMDLVLQHTLSLMIENDPPNIIYETLKHDKGHMLSFELVEDFYDQGYTIGKLNASKIKKLL